jgi:hypothetical protein
MWWLKFVILATKKVEIWKITVWGQPRQKACETPSQPITVCSSVIPSYVGKHRQEDFSLGQTKHKARPYLKNNQHGKVWQSGSSGRVQGPEYH